MQESIIKQELTPEQDAEIQEVCAEIGDVIQGAYDSLLEGREAELADAIAPLDAEEQSLREESTSIAEAAGNLELLLPAQQREAQRQADVLLLAGKLEQAETKRQEYEEARHAPEAMKARQAEIGRRIEEIADEKKAIARRCFELWYGEVRRVIRASEHALFIELLDKAHHELYAFQDHHGLQGSPLLIGILSTGLTADENSIEWKAGTRWYSGRR